MWIEKAERKSVLVSLPASMPGKHGPNDHVTKRHRLSTTFEVLSRQICEKKTEKSRRCHLEWVRLGRSWQRKRNWKENQSTSIVPLSLIRGDKQSQPAENNNENNLRKKLSYGESHALGCLTSVSPATLASVRVRQIAVKETAAKSNSGKMSFFRQKNEEGYRWQQERIRHLKRLTII